MPLYPDLVGALLHSRVQDFRDLDAETQLELTTLRESLEQFTHMDRDSVEAAIERIVRPGARPSSEQSSQPMILPLQCRWQHHREARSWACNILEGTITFAADGSQIAPTQDMSVKVGLVQIGWFSNPHSETSRYEKNVALELLTPREFDRSVDRESKNEVEWRRFNGEVTAIANFMNANSQNQALAFFDGSFIVSFVGGMQPQRQMQYTNAIQYLLEVSKKTRVPLIGYVDTSFSSDVLTLIQHATGSRHITRSSDALLLARSMHWGDRSRVFYCCRDDEVVDNAYYEQVCMTYLKTTLRNPPARIEFPRWMYDSGAYHKALDIVRAECIVGLGYPYALETADATAVLTIEDRERFQRMLQRFAERESIPLRFSRKATSKRGRR